MTLKLSNGKKIRVRPARDRAIVGFGGFHVRLARGGTPREVAEALQRLLPRFTPRLTAGELAARFVRVLRDDQEPSLSHLGPGDLAESDWLCQVSHHGHAWHARVQPLGRGEARGAVFDGLLADLPAWAASHHEPHPLEGKIVKFFYDGGSGPGDRVVRVEKITRGGDPGSILVHGKDLVRDEIRAYRSEKIRGEILLVF